MTKNYTTEELTRMSAKSKLVPSLPVVEELENINETLKAMAGKEAFNVPEVQKFTLEGAELVTIKGKDGEKGEQGEKGDKGDTGESGKDGIDGKDGKNGKDGLNAPEVDTDLLAIEAADLATKRLEPFIPKPEDLKKDILGIPVRDSLEALQEDERLDSKAIKGLDNYEERIHSLEIRPISTGGGARGFQLFTNGTKRGIVNSLNLIPGTNVTMTYNYAYGRQDVTISASGSGGAGLSVLSVTGTVDDSNLSFTVASQPTLVIINGASYRTSGDSISWTYSGTTLTLSGAVGSGGSIYALG